MIYGRKKLKGNQNEIKTESNANKEEIKSEIANQNINEVKKDKEDRGSNLNNAGIKDNGDDDEIDQKVIKEVPPLFKIPFWLISVKDDQKVLFFYLFLACN